MSLVAPLEVPTPVAPHALPGGLLNNATVVEINDPHVASGVTFQGRVFEQPEFLGELCLNDILGLGPQNRVPHGLVIGEGGPFGISVTLECAPGVPDMTPIVKQSFEYGEGWAVERAFQVGVLNPDATVLDATGTLGPVQAIALLEQWAGDQAMGRPTFHVSRFGATYLAAAKLTHEDSEFLMTTRQGSLIANSAGQGKAGPGAVVATATQFWVYVTGAVTIHRGKIEVLAAVDHKTNTSTVSAQRIYAPTYEGAAAAILVGVS